jgi:molybdopterin synthase sulfur carrier subunit
MGGKMNTVWIPTPLRIYTNGEKEIEVEGDTVGIALRELAACYPDLGRHLFDEDMRLHPFLNVFLNNDDVRSLLGEATPVGAGDRLLIVPSIAG